MKEKKDSAPMFLEHKSADHNQRVEVFSQGGNSVLCYQGRLYICDVGDEKEYFC